MASARVLSQRAVNRALLARQLLLERQVLPAGQPDRAAWVVQVIEHLVGLQAQAPFPPYYGLHSRLDGFRPEDLATLITDRSVVRIALMRGTIHLVSARDCLPLRRLLQPVIERGMRGAFGKQLAGVDPAELAAAGRRLVEAEPMTFA
ncbi:MAG: DNA glycosylase AlkZ-like family protein, partial [Streptosporangiaceae bacterium]